MRIKHRETEFELDLTTFINLMVVLLSFLLISSVVREVSVLQVNLPSSGGKGADAAAKKPLVLEVMIYPDQLLVADRQTGPMKSVPNVGGHHDYTGLNDYLKQVKHQYPSTTEASVLMLPDTPYDDLIQTMDAVRYSVEDVGINRIHTGLFPDIALGDAPAPTQGASNAR